MIKLLDVVPQLAEHLPAEQADTARATIVAPVLQLTRG
jgi:hypothetical protein